MKKRQSTVQKFSTFLSFSGTKKSFTLQWIAEPELGRTIQKHVQDHPERTTEVWALYFLTILQSKSKEEENEGTSEYLMAEKYLSAYLQEVCYQAAQKIQKQFRSIQYKYALEDLFQIGNLFANQPGKLFRSYKSDYPYTSLESYAKTAIFRFIGNAIYTQDVEAKREKFSDYGLLRDLSTKELKEALASHGITTNQIEAYCLARYCYNAVCQPQTRQGSRSLEAPSQEDLTQIAACYNQQHNSLTVPTDLRDAMTIQEMLSTCIQAAREYRTQRIVTLENDDIISDPTPTPWDTIVQIEERVQVESLVSELFTTIPETGQTLLKLWLGLNLTQAEIATVMQHKYPELQKQYQVARQLGKYSRNLIKEFLQRCRQLNPELSLQDNKAVELIQEALDECLQAHCKRLVYQYLEQFTQQYCNTEQLSYEQAEQLIEAQQGFIQAFENQLEADLNLSSESLKFVNKKIADVVSEWLRSIS